MKRFHVKRDQEVVVISGAEKGNRGKILKILSRDNRVIIEGVKMIKKHVKKNQQNPQGAIVEREGPLHISNVMAADKYDAKASRRDTPTDSN